MSRIVGSVNSSAFRERKPNFVSKTFTVTLKYETELVAELLTPIKCVVTDRHVLNGSFIGQLESLTKEVLPLVVDNYEQLPDDEKIKARFKLCRMAIVASRCEK